MELEEAFLPSLPLLFTVFVSRLGRGVGRTRRRTFDGAISHLVEARQHG
jgi:hypothetical protein